MSISIADIRKHIIIALFSDDDLLDQLVLKGGNALEVVHHVEERATLDMDFSIPEDFADFYVASTKIKRSLDREFSTLGFVVFDYSMDKKPSIVRDGQPPWWGGYLINFKLVDAGLYQKYRRDIDAIRRNSVVLGPEQKRVYKIDISKNEYCGGKEQQELDDYTIFVYSLEMIVIEKLRALCQQMEAYEHVRNKRPRPRDFFDIYQAMQRKKIDLSSDANIELMRNIFEAKDVSLQLLCAIRDTEEFHSSDWDSVTLSIHGPYQPFRFYFDFVVSLTENLKLSGKI